MLNNCTFMGRLTRGPELRRTQNSTEVVSFTIAVDRDFKPENGERETDFIDIVAWRHTAEFVSKYFGKGSMIVVHGRLQLRDWTDKDGNKRRSAEIVAENVYFAGSKRSGDGPPRASAPTYTDDDAPPPPELPPEAQAFADKWGVQVEDGERF